MVTFCFINAASRYHSSPVKQRAVLKDSKGGIAHHGRFPPIPMKKPRNACVSEAIFNVCYFIKKISNTSNAIIAMKRIT